MQRRPDRSARLKPGLGRRVVKSFEPVAQLRVHDFLDGRRVFPTQPSAEIVAVHNQNGVIDRRRVIFVLSPAQAFPQFRRRAVFAVRIQRTVGVMQPASVPAPLVLPADPGTA